MPLAFYIYMTFRETVYKGLYFLNNYTGENSTDSTYFGKFSNKWYVHGKDRANAMDGVRSVHTFVHFVVKRCAKL